MELGIPVIQSHQQLPGMLGTGFLNLGVDILQRRQVKDFPGGQLDGVEPPVFIAAHILQIDDVRRGVSPAVDADAAPGVPGNRPGRRRVISWSDPYI